MNEHSMDDRIFMDDTTMIQNYSPVSTARGCPDYSSISEIPKTLPWTPEIPKT